MIDELEKSDATFITFYSFKGGVGRSMALINTAAMLAGRGFRILVVDIDLEAPGLSYLASAKSGLELAAAQGDARLGFVDLLTDAVQRGSAADLFSLSPSELMERYSTPYELPEEMEELRGGTLQIMPAGRFDGHYARRFDELDLHGLYERGLGEPLIRAFKKRLFDSGLFDYVFIDSRTGFSDEAGICTRDLADYLVILTGLNRQNVEGTSQFLRAFRSATSGREAKFQIVLSPVPNGEDALVDEREKIARSSFERAWGGPVNLRLQIPYHPQLALTEEPHIFRRNRGYLFEAYRAIERRLLLSLGHDARGLQTATLDGLRHQDYTRALRSLRRLVRVDRGSHSLLQVANSLASLDRPTPRSKDSEVSDTDDSLERLLHDSDGRRVLELLVDHIPLDDGIWVAESFFRMLQRTTDDFVERLLTRFEAVGPESADVIMEHAVFLETRRDYDRAEEYYNRAIDRDPHNSDAMFNYADFLNKHRKNIDKADWFYRRAMELAPEDGEGLTAYAQFRVDRFNDRSGAEQLHRRAIEVDRTADNLGDYAAFLESNDESVGDAEHFYQQAIALDPANSRILGNYATFLETHRHAYDAAESFFRRALSADPRDAAVATDYAVFLNEVRGDRVAADQRFAQALASQPNNPGLLAQYATFKAYALRDLAASRDLFVRSLEAAPNDASNHVAFAVFLAESCDDRVAAARHFERALEADSENVEALWRYGQFLTEGHATDAAKYYFQRAVELAPRDAYAHEAYARFLADTERSIENAREHFAKAIELEPQNANLLGNLALYLAMYSRDVKETQGFFVRALDVDPAHANNLSNYASFARTHLHDLDFAESLYRRSLDANPAHRLAVSGYVSLLLDERSDRRAVTEVYERAVSHASADADLLIDYAIFLESEGEVSLAESYYLRAVEREPKNVWALHEYARFLFAQRKDAISADSLFRRALDVSPNNATLLSEYGQFLAASGQLAESERFLRLAVEGRDVLERSERVEVLIALWLVLKGLHKSVVDCEKMLDDLFQEEFSRYEWSFENIIERVSADLSADELELAHLFADAFGSEEGARRLFDSAVWKAEKESWSTDADQAARRTAGEGSERT